MDKQIIDIATLKHSHNNENTSDDLKSETNYKTIMKKLFSNKGIKIIILAIVCLLTLFIFLGIGKGKNVEDLTETQQSNKNYTTTLEYCAELENKLETLLSKMHGAGDVSVMISVDGSPELIYATSDDNKVSNNSSGSTTTSSSNLIIVENDGNEKPLVLTENLPNVKGVIVVSSGANDISVKLDILNAISTLLNISTDKISVLKGI